MEDHRLVDLYDVLAVSADATRLFSSGAGFLAASGVVVQAGRTRHRANREVSGVLLPSRQVICCQASAASSRASVFADTRLDAVPHHGATACRAGRGLSGMPVATALHRDARPS